ncbi:MAG TPA: hypothetical protein VEL31_26470 [Ktedonobacteraceae bacterium]|nr:hypothetical protein [Ktedonobacteraceae bacterium]
MPISKHEALDQIKLTTLADLCTDELRRYRCNEPANDRYFVELLRRAIVEHSDHARSLLQQCLSETIRTWIRSHPNGDLTLLHSSEENFIAQTFSRFWYAVHDQHVEFNTLSVALRYLRATLNGILIDTQRLQLRGVSLPKPGCSGELAAEEPIDAQNIWKIIESLLFDARERRIAYLLYFCGLKPREIVIRCPKEFDDVKEIYHLRHTIVEQLQRNRGRLRHVLG